MTLIGGWAETVGVAKRATATDRGKNLGEIGILTAVIVNVVGCHYPEVETTGYFPNQIVAGIVLGHAVVPQLEIETLAEYLTK